MVDLLLCLLPLVAAPATPAVDDAPVREAIVQAVRRRMGSTTTVVIEDLRVMTAVAAAVIEAVPDPGSRLGRPMHFTLKAVDPGRGRARTSRTGFAEARLRVSVAHAHLSRAVARGEVLADEDVVAADDEIADGPLEGLPSAEALRRGKALRDLAPGTCVARSRVLIAPVVRTGDDVTVFVRSAGVEVSARMVAASSGDPGALVRVVNQQSRRAFKARVVSPGIVEMIP